ncbi:hypothetical protein [Pseudanabaena sp. PCC 6802]|uniref:hypothetical protein n=1 Tax=Pseudanabaena sp. PCC 6802 TaxID=118173 RepID=UPI000344D0E1|nr:hypothetical protein [Pseudanabaena sp. PCC 6802]
MATQAAIRIEDASPIAELGQYANVQAIQELIAEAGGKQPAKHTTKEELFKEVEQLLASQIMTIKLLTLAAEVKSNNMAESGAKSWL